MGIVIGIDVGISTTKIVGINRDSIVISPLRIKATDPITSLYGAFGKYLYDNKISLSDVEQVMLTGVGSAYIDTPIYGLPTGKAEEFLADGLGARYETGLDRMIVVSMGTGTSLVQCDGPRIEHIGGIGIGGGTLQGLSRILLKTDDIKQVSTLAMQGDISNINLLIGDISAQPLPGLPMDATASLFGNAKSNASREDIALGLVCLVLQSIGSGTLLSQHGHQRVCPHRQPHPPATVQRGISGHGTALPRALPHPQIQRILYCHRGSPPLFQNPSRSPSKIKYGLRPAQSAPK